MSAVDERDGLLVAADAPHEQVKDKYRAVATDPQGDDHFHTGRPLAKRLGYDAGIVDPPPDAAVESFAGVANPFAPRRLKEGENVVNAGAGGEANARAVEVFGYPFLARKP